MSRASLQPERRSDTSLRAHPDGGALLHHDAFGTQLHLEAEERIIIEKLDGEHNLEQLEELLAKRRGTIAYQDLVLLLFRLWDRGFLQNEDEVRASLFPHHRQRTLDRALAWRRSKALLSWSLMGQGPFRSWPRLEAILSSTITLGAEALLLVLAVALVLSGQVVPPANLFQYEGAWECGILLVYGSAAAILSLRGLVRALLLSALGTGVRKAGLKLTAAVAHFDVDDGEVFHLSRKDQIRFALAGSLVFGVLACALQLARLAGAPAWADWCWATALLLLFIDLCPFFRTDGARLLEVLAKLPKQRFRVGTFIGQRLVRGLFSRSEAESGESHYFPLAATAWIIWFFLGMKLFLSLFLGHILALEAALLASPSLPLLLAGGLFFLYTVILLLSLLGTILTVCVKLIVQIFTPERSDPPELRHGIASLTAEKREELIGHLEALSFVRLLPQPTMEEILERMEEHSFPAGTWIRRARKQDDSLHLILEGRIELFQRLPEGGHRLVASRSAGETLGEEALLGMTARYDARAAEQTRLLVLHGETVRTLRAARESGTEELTQLLRVAGFLDQVPELAGLGPAGRLALAANITELEKEPGEEILREGEDSDSLYVIRSGDCRVSQVQADGSHTELAQLGPGQMFGEIGVLFRKPRSATVRCAAASRIIEIPRAVLDEALHGSFHVGLALERLATSRLGGGG